MNKQILLSMENVNLHYDKNKEQKPVGLRAIDLTINQHEWVAIIGASGCGKSSLLRLMAGLNQATCGNIRYLDQPLCGINQHSKMVFQQYALLPWLNVFDNIAIGLHQKNLDPNTLNIHVKTAVTQVGLQDFIHAYPNELSGGMCQRVGFARALIAKPQLLLLDEAFSALDALTSRHLRADLMHHWHNGRMQTQSVVMVTHDVTEAIEMADRILVMTGQPGTISYEVIMKQQQSHEQLMHDLYDMMSQNAQ